MLLSLVLIPAAAGSQTSPGSEQDDVRFKTALRGILSPAADAVQYDYVMTAKLRLLLFWVGADDVGGGYVRRSRNSSQPDGNMIQVLFGSDPARAPRKINYWGAATESWNAESSALLGFMKGGKTGSASEAEADLRNQSAGGRHPFEAIISVVQKDRAVSRRASISSTTDLNLHQLDLAQKLAVEELGNDGPIRELSGTKLECRTPRGFLQAVDELIEYTLSSNTLPRFVCYVHNGRNYTISLQKRSKVSAHSVKLQRKKGGKLEKSYRDLIEGHFSVLNQSSGESTSFQLLLGTAGPLRGVPVQITYQPNWWFRVVLNLDGQS
jgi:hypothetical protein